MKVKKFRQASSLLTVTDKSFVGRVISKIDNKAGGTILASKPPLARMSRWILHSRSLCCCLQSSYFHYVLNIRYKICIFHDTPLSDWSYKHLYVSTLVRNDLSIGLKFITLWH